MNILILNWRDIKHPLAGGAEISLLEHAKVWKRKGATILWVSSSFPGSSKIDEIDGISIQRHGSVYTVHLLTFLAALTGRYRSYNVIIDSFHFIPYFSIFYPRSKRTKIIGLINEVAGKLWFSNLFGPFALIGFLMEPFILALYKNKQFITGSNSTRQDLLRFGFAKSMVSVVAHGVHLQSVSDLITKEKKPTILFLGRVSQDKGIFDACKIFSSILKAIPDAQFWIAGKEEKTGTIQKIFRTFPQIKDSMWYFGFVDEKTKFEMYKKAWLLLHPSEKEGWGLTVIEAASQGTPAVGYNVEGLRDSIQHNKTGLLVKPWNLEDFSDTIVQVLRDKNQYKKLCANAVTWSQEFDWQKSSGKSWQIIEKEVRT